MRPFVNADEEAKYRAEHDQRNGRDPDDGPRFSPTRLSTVDAATPELLAGIVYRGFPSNFFGPTGSAKTLLAQALTLEMVRIRLRVAYSDEELGSKPMAARWRALGATDAELDLITYFEWQGPGMTDSEAFVEAVAGHDVVVLDPVADHLGAAGIDENSNAEYTAWTKLYPQRLTHEGIASILIDGAPHADGNGRDGRQRGATQKGYKAALAWRIEVLDEPAKDAVGLVRLTCTKDRFGDVGRGATITFRIGGEAGRIVFERVESMRRPPKAEQAATDRTLWVGYVVATLQKHALGEANAITANQLVGLLPPGKGRAFCLDMAREAAGDPFQPVRVGPGTNRSLRYWHDDPVVQGGTEPPVYHPDIGTTREPPSGGSGGTGLYGNHPPVPPAGTTGTAAQVVLGEVSSDDPPVPPGTVRETLPAGVGALYHPDANWALLDRGGVLTKGTP